VLTLRAGFKVSPLFSFYNEKLLILFARLTNYAARTKCSPLTASLIWFDSL
jgi:hypothetical protein